MQERTPVLLVDQSIDEGERQDLARRVSRETKQVFDRLSHALKIHLNLKQAFEVNSSTLFVQLESVTNDSLIDKEIQTIGEARLRFPNQSLRIENYDSNEYYSLRVSLLLQARENER